MKKIIGIICVVFLVALFLYAALYKIFTFKEFVDQLNESPLKSYRPLVAWGIPTIEIATAVFLLFKRTRIFGFYCSFILMTGFTLYIYILLHFSDRLPCGCGGIISKLSWGQHFWFNLLFLLLSMLGMYTISENKRMNYSNL